MASAVLRLPLENRILVATDRISFVEDRISSAMDRISFIVDRISAEKPKSRMFSSQAKHTGVRHSKTQDAQTWESAVLRFPLFLLCNFLRSGSARRKRRLDIR